MQPIKTQEEANNIVIQMRAAIGPNERRGILFGSELGEYLKRHRALSDCSRMQWLAQMKTITGYGHAWIQFLINLHYLTTLYP